MRSSEHAPLQKYSSPMTSKMKSQTTCFAVDLQEPSFLLINGTMILDNTHHMLLGIRDKYGRVICMCIWKRGFCLEKMALTGKRQADTVRRRRCTRVPRSCQQKTWSPRSCFIHCIMLSHSARPRRHAVQEVFLRQRERI